MARKQENLSWNKLIYAHIMDNSSVPTNTSLETQNAIVETSSLLTLKSVSTHLLWCLLVLNHAGELSEEDLPSRFLGNLQAIGVISVMLYDIYNVRQVPAISPIRDSSRHKRIERMTEKSMKGDTRSHSFT